MCTGDPDAPDQKEQFNMCECIKKNLFEPELH